MKGGGGMGRNKNEWERMGTNGRMGGWEDGRMGGWGGWGRQRDGAEWRSLTLRPLTVCVAELKVNLLQSIKVKQLKS